MRPLIAAVCLLLLIAAPVGAQSGPTLEERVASLEAQVAELRALHDLTEPKAGNNTFEWSRGPIPACARGQWFEGWTGYAVKGLEVQFDQ